MNSSVHMANFDFMLTLKMIVKKVNLWYELLSLSQHECMCGHEKGLTSGAQRTEGGGDPLPIRGTFSWRGFPPNRADWFLSKQDSDVRKEKMRARVQDRVRKEIF